MKVVLCVRIGIDDASIFDDKANSQLGNIIYAKLVIRNPIRPIDTYNPELLSGKENRATVAFFPVSGLHPFDHKIQLTNVRKIQRSCSEQTHIDDSDDVQSLTFILVNALINIVSPSSAVEMTDLL